MTDKNPEYPSEQQRPTRLQVRLELGVDPGSASFVRHLEFIHHESDAPRIQIPLAFTRGSGLVWSFDTAAAYLSSDRATRAYAGQALHLLGRLVDLGNRTYWDRMVLANRGGSKALEVARLRIALTYGGVTYDRPPELAEREIAIVDAALNARLPANDGQISLTNAAALTRRAFAGIDPDASQLLRLLADDLGKSGSDAADNFGGNPKYGPRIENLCSEFASWYYFQAGITIHNTSVRDVVETQSLHDLFKAAGRLYSYDNAADRLVKVGGTGTYVPRPGDFLERRGDGRAEHSMIILRWIPGDPAASVEHEKTARAIVFNGPWPVFLREVRLRERERKDGDDYYVGRI